MNDKAESNTQSIELSAIEAFKIIAIVTAALVSSASLVAGLLLALVGAALGSDSMLGAAQTSFSLMVTTFIGCIAMTGSYGWAARHDTQADI